MGKRNIDNYTLEQINEAIEDSPEAHISAGAMKLYIDLREEAFIKKYGLKPTEEWFKENQEKLEKEIDGKKEGDNKGEAD